MIPYVTSYIHFNRCRCRGGDRLKKDCYALRQLRNGLCTVCVPFKRVNGQDNIYKCLWTGYGSRCQAHQFEWRTATLLGFSHSKVSRVYQEWSTIQRTSSQLDITVGSSGVNMGQHPCGTLSKHSSVHALMLFWGQKGCNKVLGSFSKCFVHCI